MERVIVRSTPSLLAVSAATVTVAYYQLSNPILQTIMAMSLGWWILRSRSGRGVEADAPAWLLSSVFMLYGLVALVSAGLAGFNPDALDRLGNFVVFLAGALMIPFLVRVRPDPLWFWSAAAATAALSGIYAFWEMASFSPGYELANGVPYRAGGSKGKPIPFGDIATLSALLSLLGASVCLQARRPLWSLPLLGAAGLGLYASLASGTRGAWLVYPSGLVVVGLHLLHGYPRRRRAILLGAAGILLTGAGLMIQSDQIRERVGTALNEIRDYRLGASLASESSVGERLEMWRTAWRAYEEHPLLGIGVGQLNAYFRKAADAGLVSRAIVEVDEGQGRTHAHNDYIHALATRGLIGLGSLLLLYLVPLAVFARHAFLAREASRRALGYAGALVILAFMQYSLTDSVLLMRISGGYFVLLTCWLLAMGLSPHPCSACRPNALGISP